jgi:energy-coupling factor transport system ATP-binding protein
MVVVDRVTYRYRGSSAKALNNLSLTVSPGEAVCIMGANGSGKSTLARLIAGLAKPAEGEIAVFGQNPTAARGPALVGLLFQNPDNQMVAILVDQEVAFALENRAVPVDEMRTRVRGSLDNFGIRKLERRLTSELSGGEKQRVALAAATVERPPVLVLDEPDSYLDEQGRRILADQLARLRRDYPDLIEVRITQYPHVAATYSRLVVMSDGRIAADGSPSELLADRSLLERTGLSAEGFDPGEAASEIKLPRLPTHRKHRPAAVRLHEVSFAYQSDQPVVDGVDFEVAAGETVALIGPTGSGKSTLGLILCGILDPIDGALRFLDDAGEPIAGKPHPCWVTAALQQPERQFFLTTCAEEVRFGPANTGIQMTPAQVDRFLDLVGLEPLIFRDRDPFSLSLGEKRRLAFATVLAMSPAFVVFDEPTASLDPSGVARFTRLSRTLRSQGLGQVVISHDGDIVAAVADRVVALTTDGPPRRFTTPEFFDGRHHIGLVSLPQNQHI